MQLVIVTLVALLANSVANGEQALAYSHRQELRAKLREHPIEGVITMLKDLAEQAKQEGKDEAGDYDKYVAWCTDSKTELNEAIASEKSTISALTDELSSLKDQIATTEDDIAYLGAQIEEQTAADVKAKKSREKKHDLYEDEQTNYEDTIEAVDTALEGLQAAEDQAADDGFLQVSAHLPENVRKAALLTEWRMSDDQHQSVKNFLSSPAFLQANQVPKKVEAHAGGAVETFKEMDEDFKADKEASIEDENHAKNEYNLAKAARKEAIDAADDAKTEKETILGDKKGRKAEAEKEKEEEEKSLVADSATLDSTTKDCATTAEQFKERTKIRTGEIAAMEMAVKILAKVTNVRNPDEHEIPAKEGFVQKSATPKFDYGQADDAVGFLQTHRHHHHRSHHRHHGAHKHTKRRSREAALAETRRLEAPALALIRHAANESHAVHVAALSQLAAQLEVYDGPFDKIKAMIQKMIFHLMNEQTEEDQHKDWCDLETEKSTEEKEDKVQKLKEFAKKIEELDSTIAELISKIADNTQKVEDINTHMKEETELRTTNHKEIEATIKDAKDAQAAIAEATAVLTSFYKESGMIPKEPWEFIQSAAHDVELPEKPSTWDSSYTGVSDPKSGDNAVLELLSKVNEKFAGMESTAKVQDDTDQKNYDADMQAKKIELSETEMDTTMKTETKTSLEEKVDGMREAVSHMDRELSSVEAYLKDLQPSCGDGEVSYEDRKKARTDETEALRKAQTILEDAFRGSDEE